MKTLKFVKNQSHKLPKIHKTLENLCNGKNMIRCVFTYVLICCSHLIEWNNPSQIIIKKVFPHHFVLCTFIILLSTHDTYVKSACYNYEHTSGFAYWKKRAFVKIMQKLPPTLINVFQATHVMTT
jgi:hypothetical protein